MEGGEGRARTAGGQEREGGWERERMREGGEAEGDGGEKGEGSERAQTRAGGQEVPLAKGREGERRIEERVPKGEADRNNIERQKTPTSL
jgi:hypothetical protein